MRKRSLFTLMLLALLLTASNVAMAAHDVGHTMDPDNTQQCPLCTSGTQPCADPIPDAVSELPYLTNFHTNPATTGCLQSKATHHDHSPRAPPSIA